MKYAIHVASAKPAEEFYQKSLKEKGEKLHAKLKKKLALKDKMELKEKQTLLTEANEKLENECFLTDSEMFVKPMKTKQRNFM